MGLFYTHNVDQQKPDTKNICCIIYFGVLQKQVKLISGVISQNNALLEVQRLESGTGTSWNTENVPYLALSSNPL